jgi:type IV pilus assembly protein PilW
MKILCHRKDRGYSLVELMIAIVIGAILIAASSATYIAQNRSYTVQESVSEINSQAKTALDLIANDIRSAGFGVPEDLNADPINGFTSIITPVDSSSGPDTITVLTKSMTGDLWPSGVGPETIACPTPPSVKLDGVPSETIQVNINSNGSDLPNTTDRSFLSIDGVNFVRVQSCALVDGNCTNPVSIDRKIRQDVPLLDTNASGNCDTGRPVYLIRDTTFCVDSNMTLRRGDAGVAACMAGGGEEIAEFIEDLQFSYGLDADDDGMLDGGAFIDGDSVLDHSEIAAVRVSILARADRPDVNYGGQGNPPASIENRNHAQTDDNFRRRWWQTTVTLRNK